jgi:2-dehydro-3-deoxyphosphooctonate aldolase (KDO 8-P synthase)
MPGFSIGEGSLTIIAGPCLAESEEMCLRVAAQMKELCADLGFNYIFKASYDKANRTSVNTVRGSGMEAGLEILQKVAQVHGLPTTTDIHTADQASEAAGVVDLLQIPAFLCRQTDIL